MAQAKKFGKSAQQAAANETFLESEDWQKVLQEKFKAQEIEK